jgi:hypothetical protein
MRRLPLTAFSLSLQERAGVRAESDSQRGSYFPNAPLSFPSSGLMVTLFFTRFFGWKGTIILQLRNE